MDLGHNKVIEFRAAVLNLYLVISSVASAAIIPIYYLIGITPLTLICIAYGVIIVGTYGLFRSKRIGLTVASRTFLALTFLVCMAGLYLGDETLDNKPWQLLVPLAAFTVSGPREGTWWALASFIAALVICLLRWPVYAPFSITVLLMAHATTVVALYFYTRHSEGSLRTVAELSHTDSLTGLYNRLFFEELVQQTFNRSRRAGEPLAVFMIDIDHFKPFNDTYGHAAGDAALVAVAGVIQASARRATDLVFRYGGEEFCIFSAGLDAAEAATLAGNILDGIRGLRIPHVAGEHGLLTVSVGIAQRTQLDSESVEGLLRRADEAMYRAKRGGRDRAATELAAERPLTDVSEPAA